MALAVSLLCIFTACSTSQHARIGGTGTDMLAVQSSFEMRKAYPAETASMELIAPEKISTTQTALSAAPETKPAMEMSSFETVTRHSVKVEMRQFTREQKKELRKAILYAYLGKEIPVSKNTQKGGAPFVDRTAAAIIAFFIPALGAGLYFGKDKRTWISLALMLLFWLPGAIYAIIMILRD